MLHLQGGRKVAANGTWLYAGGAKISQNFQPVQKIIKNT